MWSHAKGVDWKGPCRSCRSITDHGYSHGPIPGCPASRTDCRPPVSGSGWHSVVALCRLVTLPSSKEPATKLAHYVALRLHAHALLRSPAFCAPLGHPVRCGKYSRLIATTVTPSTLSSQQSQSPIAPRATPRRFPAEASFSGPSYEA